MNNKFNIDKLLKTDVSPYLNKHYIDMLNVLDELNKTYEKVRTSLSPIMNSVVFDDLYWSYMSMSAAFDSTRKGLKGEARYKILELSYRKKYKTIENHISLLKDRNWEITEENIKEMHRLLHAKDIVNSGKYRKIPKYRYYRSGKLQCSTSINSDMKKLIDFINDENFGNYTIVNIVIMQLGIISIAPFNKNNRFISLAIADKLISKHYGKPIFMETVLYKLGHKKNIITNIQKYWNDGFLHDLVKIYLDAIMQEMNANIIFLNKLEYDIFLLNQSLTKTNIKKQFIPYIIRFLILNNTFKIKELYDKLEIKDRRTILKITKELEKVKLIKNISDSHIRKYQVIDKFENDFVLLYE